MSETPRATWTIHLARAKPERALVGIGSFLFVGAVVGVSQGGALLGVLAVGVLFGSTVTFWLPRRYALFDDRIEMTPWGWSRAAVYPFARFRAAFVDRASVFLSTTERADGMARYRGLTVFLNPGAEAIAERIVQRVADGAGGAP